MPSEEIADVAARAARLRLAIETTSLADVHSTFAEYLYLPDMAVVDIAIATVVAHRLGGDPVWTLLVGPPGFTKTEVIRALSELPEVHALSSLTAQTFASGLKGQTQASLLRRLEKEHRSFLTLKDFTTVLTMHREARAEIFAQLREIYDGAYRKEFGTGESVSWEGRLGFLAGVTQAIDTHHSASAMLGERFLYLRLPQVPRRKMARSALEDRGREKAMREELRRVIRAFVDGLGLDALDGRPGELTEEVKEQVISLADFTTWVRSGVARDSYISRDIIAVPQPEAPTRFAKQIASLYEALVLLGHQAAMELVRRVSYDSIPPERLAALRALRREASPSTTELASGIGLPTTSTRRVVEDLTALRLVCRSTGGDGKADRWVLAPEAAAIWEEADPQR